MEGAAKSAICLAGPDVDRLREVAGSGEFFWLDLHAPTDAEIQAVGETLGFHPLSIEDSQHFGQRPKVEQYRDHIFAVFFGAAPGDDPDRLVEVHIYFNGRFIVTIHRDASPQLDALERRVERNGLTGHRLLHAILDVLVDSFADVLDELGTELDEIEARIFDQKQRSDDGEIYHLRRQLATLSRTLYRQRDLFGPLVDGLKQLPGFDEALKPYFDDVRDHLWRMSEVADTLRDRTAGVVELYLAAVSNRMNVVMKQFTVIAGIFLPLSVVVGFFGMNFAWMERHIESGLAFWLLGVGFPIAVTAALLWWFTHRGWLREDD